MPSPQPFSIHVEDAVLADLAERLARVRWPDEVPGSDWAYGASLAYLRDLVGYWQERYDWRSHEARLNAFAHFQIVIRLLPPVRELRNTPS